MAMPELTTLCIDPLLAGRTRQKTRMFPLRPCQDMKDTL